MTVIKLHLLPVVFPTYFVHDKWNNYAEAGKRYIQSFQRKQLDIISCYLHTSMATVFSNCCAIFQITRQNAVIHWSLSTAEFSFLQYNTQVQNDLVTDCKFNFCWQTYQIQNVKLIMKGKNFIFKNNCLNLLV